MCINLFKKKLIILYVRLVINHVNHVQNALFLNSKIKERN